MHHASCQCGNLFISARSDPDFVIACNCKLCQRRSGSPFGAAGYFLKSDLTFTGTPKQVLGGRRPLGFAEAASRPQDPSRLRTLPLGHLPLPHGRRPTRSGGQAVLSPI